MENNTATRKEPHVHPREAYLRGHISELRQSIELLKELKTESDPKYSAAIEMAKEALYHDMYRTHRMIFHPPPAHIQTIIKKKKERFIL